MAAQPRVLIIEEDKVLADIYRAGFSAAGFAVAVAYDGEDGLAQMLDMPPSAVILDLMLPKLSGFEVMERMRDAAEFKSVPVIVVTNLDQHTERDRALALGAKAYVVKAHAVFSDVLGKVKELVR